LVGIFGLFITYNLSFGWSRKKSVAFANFDAISKVTRQIIFPRRITPLIVRSVILFFLILGMSGFGIWHEGKVSGIDYIIAIDSSGSMLADDFEPNRLEVAKRTAVDFVDSLDAQANIGVVSFTGTPIVDQSLTKDKDLVKNAILDIGGTYSAGTSIGDALILSASILDSGIDTNNSRAIILLTDGRINVGIESQVAINYVRERGIVVHTIGIGTEEGGVFAGDMAVSTIDFVSLQALANETGGESYLVDSEDSLKNAYSEIYTIEEGQVFFDAGKYLLLFAFLFLLGEWILANTRYKTII